MAITGLAKTRKGFACQRPAFKHNGRGSLHGGLSTSAKTADGFTRGTNAIAQCVQTATARAEADWIRRWQAIKEADKALQGPATTTTNCTAFGNSMNCRSSTW